MEQRISLNGLWDYQPLAWTTLLPDGAIREERTDLPPPGAMELPMNWQLRGLDSFNGRVRFTRTFFAPDCVPHARVFLIFRGVDYFADVTLNGHHLGRHAGYFQPFEFEITTLLQPGENELQVDVDCPLEEPGTVWPDHKLMLKGVLSHWDCRPGGWDPATGQDKNSGGIWHDVELEIRAADHLGYIKTTTTLVPDNVPTDFELLGAVDVSGLPQRALVSVDCEIHGRPGAYALAVRIGDHAQEMRPIILQRSGETHTVIVAVRNPQLWWTWDLGEPHLENCTVQLQRDGQVVSEKQFEIGLRSIEFDTATGQWMLNGTRVFVRGTNIVPTLWLGEYNDAMIARDIDLLRNAHVNGVRVCVHVNRSEFYAACDRAGILVWQDFAFQWGYTATLDFMHEAVRQIKEMVRLLVNHPSVALWCTQNESGVYNPAVLAPMLAAAIAAEDTSRHIHPVSEVQEHTYAGWYYGTLHEYAQLPATPVLTEFGAQALPDVESVHAMFGPEWPPDWDAMGYHDFQYYETVEIAGVEPGDGWAEFVANSQAYQARLLKVALETYRKAKYDALGGLFQFMFVECWPSVTWAVVGYNRNPKQGYQVLKQCYQPILIGIDQMGNVRNRTLVGPTNRGALALSMPITPWVVNDTHASLTGLTYTVQLVGQGAEFTFDMDETFDVPADAVTLTLPPFALALPARTSTGDYQLHLTLMQGTHVLSHNQYDWTVVRVPTSRELERS